MTEKNTDEIIGVLVHPVAGVLATFKTAEGEIEFEDGKVLRIEAVMELTDHDPQTPACLITFDASDYVTEPWRVIYTISEEDGSHGLGLGKPMTTMNDAIEEAYKVYSGILWELLQEEEGTDERDPD